MNKKGIGKGIKGIVAACLLLGIALPFFSYGGTALAVNLAEMGIVLSISRYRNAAAQQEEEI